MGKKRAPRTYGYIRVSAKDQNEDRQRIAMAHAGVKRKNIYIDKQSGKDFERKGYQELLRQLCEGDLLIIKSIDRLGRNYTEILEQWRILTKEIGVDVRVLDMPLLDTTLSKDLLGTFIADLVLQVLSFVAENERQNILQRQKEGIEAAKLRGVHMGRPRQESEELHQALSLYMNRQIPLQQAIDMSGFSRSGFYKRLGEATETGRNEHH